MQSKILENRESVRTYLFIMVLFSSTQSFAQNATIKGLVADSLGLPLAYACICLQGDECLATTNEKGKFALKNVKKGYYTISVIYIGYETYSQKIVLAEGDDLTVRIVMKSKVLHSDEVTIHSTSKAQALKESPQQVTVIEAKKYYNQSASTSDIINRSSGVRVRQNGGLGSTANFSINGISGKQVKIFLDGIPIEYYGAEMNINVIPINQMERMEIYKGAVPIELGGDALGGAINVITRKSRKSFSDLSYSFGSFNTHKANLNSKIYLDSSNIFVGLHGFYNYSDNNYKVNVEVPNESGNPENRLVRRFHDRFNSYMGRVELGIINKKFADELVLGILQSGLSREIQHNMIMSQPFGQAMFGQNSRGINLKYLKHNLIKNLTLEAFAGYNGNNSSFVDTTLNVYTWDGRIFTQRQYGGEISNSMNNLSLYAHNGILRVNLKYQLANKHSVSLNSIHLQFKRKGKDPIAAAYYQDDIYMQDL